MAVSMKVQKQKQNDEQRERIWGLEGINFLRFENEVIERRMQEAIQTIECYITNYKSK